MTFDFAKQKVFLIIIGVVIVIAAIPSVYFYFQYKKAQESLQNPQAFSQEEINKLVEHVGKFMELPEGEVPTIATVTDSEKLKDQQFFSRAQNGDKVLIYTNAKKAILYRAESNKIIEVAPINIGPPATPSAQTQRQQALGTVIIRNGTQEVGLTKTIEDELTKNVPGVAIVDRGNATRRDYTSSLLVDVKGTNATAATTISRALGMVVGPLPKDESTPSADFLIIAGSDKK